MNGGMIQPSLVHLFLSSAYLNPYSHHSPAHSPCLQSSNTKASPYLGTIDLAFLFPSSPEDEDDKGDSNNRKEEEELQ